MLNLVSLTHPSLHVLGKKSGRGISDFRISDQSLVKENCQNSRTGDGIDMKIGPVTKLDERNKTTPKRFKGSVMSDYCDVIVIFPIFGQFGAIRRADSKRTVCKAYIFINGNLLSCKN